MREICTLFDACMVERCRMSFFFFNDTATTEIYTLSLHDALPISSRDGSNHPCVSPTGVSTSGSRDIGDRKSTRLNSSHVEISYAVFCLKKKKQRSGVLNSLRAQLTRRNSPHRVSFAASGHLCSNK